MLWNKRTQLTLLSMKAGKKKINPIKQEADYVAFLSKRVNSKNFKNNVSEEEFAKTKEKLEKAKLKLRLLTGKF